MNYYAIQSEEILDKKYPGLLSAVKSPQCRTVSECCSTVVKFLRPLKVGRDESMEVSILAFFVSRWREHRAIYHFDFDLFSELLAQAVRMDCDDDLPTDLLRNLPYPCFSVEASPFSTGLKNGERGPLFSGRMFITTILADDMALPWDALAVMAEDSFQSSPVFFLPLLGTLSDSLEALNAYHNESCNRKVTEDETQIDAAPALLAAQMVLYLQAQNADLQAKPSAKKKKGKSRNAGAKPPKVVDVGYHIGSVLRKARVKYESSSTGTGASKRPHSRRGHYHRFWTGSLSRPDERKLVVKWVHPTLIHAGDDKATVRKVK